MYNVRPEDSISSDEFTTSLKLNSMTECLQNTRLQWFSYLEKIEDRTSQQGPS